MNLRILKKLSKRAAPLLPLLGDDRKQFRAERFDNFTNTLITDRKHWERHCTVWKSPEPNTPGRIFFTTRTGRIAYMTNHYVHPRKGTIMVGAVSGGEEPEWDEETAWDSLREIVWWHFVHYDGTQDSPVQRRSLRTPAEVFAAAAEIITSRGSHGGSGNG